MSYFSYEIIVAWLVIYCTKQTKVFCSEDNAL